jgi:hypothetical protein
VKGVSSAAAQRGYDHHFISGAQGTVESLGHFAIDEKADVLADAVLLVDDAVTHAGVARIERFQQSGQRFAFGLDLLLTAGVGKKRAWNEDTDQATATE